MNPFIDDRRARMAAALELGESLLLIGAGDPVPLPEGTDQVYPFRSHAEYFYLTARECAGGVLAFDPLEGERAGWISFVPEVTEAERIWEGRSQPDGTFMFELARWLKQRAGRPVVMLGAPLPSLQYDETRTSKTRERFTHARRAKDPAELGVLQRSAIATAAGFQKLQECIRVGVTERALQVELEAEFFRHGATRTGYETIVGTGPNSAVLHFPPGARVLREGDFVLVDAGAEVDRYVTDVTRTYVVDAPSPFQRDLYAVVLAAEERAIARCVAGAEWTALHLMTAVDLVEGLVNLGVMRGKPETLVEHEAHTLFFPHGLGHLVGLGVRDGSGLFPGRSKDPRPSLRTLRMDLPLAPGYVVTIEPGIYFIPALLNDPKRREQFRDQVNWPFVEQHLGLGGVRIEDNILVTQDEPQNLTRAIPKGL